MPILYCMFSIFATVLDRIAGLVRVLYETAENLIWNYRRAQKIKRRNSAHHRTPVSWSDFREQKPVSPYWRNRIAK